MAGRAPKAGMPFKRIRLGCEKLSDVLQLVETHRRNSLADIFGDCDQKLMDVYDSKMPFMLRDYTAGISQRIIRFNYSRQNQLECAASNGNRYPPYPQVMATAISQ